MVDFALVGALVAILLVGVVQLTIALHVRNVLIDSASEGARYGALEGHAPADGAARTGELIGQSLAPEFAQDIVARRTVVDGLEVVEVEVAAPLPVVGLLGPGGIRVRGHALAEDALP